MKSLNDFKQVVQEEQEKSDYKQFDVLVRAGLANKAQMQRIHRILDKMQEERPVFNNADRAILQNLFNKMVDLVSNNKMIFQQTRRAVREDVELEEGMQDTADFKIGPSGKKVKAHRVKIGDTDEIIAKEETVYITEEQQPPFVLVLKRKAIRFMPEGIKMALYYNEKLNRYFTIPWAPGTPMDSPITTTNEEVEELEEAVMDTLHKIVNEKQARSVKFASGHTRKVDGYTASAIVNVHKALNDDNKKKFADMVHKSPDHFTKAADFAFKHSK